MTEDSYSQNEDDVHKWNLRVGVIFTSREAEQGEDVVLLADSFGRDFDVTVWRRGEPMTKHGPRAYTTTGFRADIFNGINGDPAEQVDRLVKWLLAAPIKNGATRAAGQIALNIKLLDQFMPPLLFSNDILWGVASLGLNIDIDLYDFRDHAPEAEKRP